MYTQQISIVFRVSDSKRNTVLAQLVNALVLSRTVKPKSAGGAIYFSLYLFIF